MACLLVSRDGQTCQTSQAGPTNCLFLSFSPPYI
nr:MAG TPA: PAB-dependent polyA-specific ribonuclease subunit [Caudoviricetes sp.]